VPCYRCNARQTDPARGASPWGRAVIGGEQILVCPDCQSGADWRAPLDRCATCGSTHLAKALGQVVCRDCGARADRGRPSAGVRGAVGDQGPAGVQARAGEDGQPAASRASRPSRLVGPIPEPADSPDPARSARAADGAAAEPAASAGRAAPAGPAAPAGQVASAGPAAAAEQAAPPGAAPARRGQSDLAADVEAALARMFGRGRAAAGDPPRHPVDDR
jgi:hypothetical protein